jgi:hypothetical protein
MKVNIENTDNNELYYLFNEIINITENVRERYYYKFLFYIINNYIDKTEINSIYDAAFKYYVIAFISDKKEENTSYYYFYNPIYIYRNGQLSLYVGSLYYKHFTFNPLLKLYNNIIERRKITDQHKEYKNDIINIKYTSLVNSLSFNKSYFNSNANIIDLIMNINLLNIENYNKYKVQIPSLIDEYEHNAKPTATSLLYKSGVCCNIRDKVGFPKHKFDNSITNRLTDIYYILNNIAITLRDAPLLDIIKKYLNSKAFKNFYYKYNIHKKIEESLSKKEYDFVIQLYEKEKKYSEGLKNNKCEHLSLLEKKEMDKIIKLYIPGDFDYDNLSSNDDWIYCIKCNYPLICPHVIHKYLYPNKNLNRFVYADNSLNSEVFCKICGEFLWKNTYNLNYVKPGNVFSYKDIVDLDQSDNIGQMIYRGLYNYIFSRNLIIAKKKIRNDLILNFVKDHIQDDLETQFIEINKSLTMSNDYKIINKFFLLYVYIWCSLVHLCIINNNKLTLFNVKVNNIDKIINNLIQDIKQSNKNIIHRYNDQQLTKLLYTVFEQISHFIPNNTELHEFDINIIKKQNIHTFEIYKYIYLINSIYFGSYFDEEHVLNTSFNDINVNFNTVFIPTLPFLQKKGGDSKNIKPVIFQESDLNNKAMNIFIDFVNNDYVFSYLKNNQNYLQLKKNIKDIKKKPIKVNNAYKINTLKEKYGFINLVNYHIKMDYFKYKFTTYKFYKVEVINKNIKSDLTINYKKTKIVLDEQIKNINKIFNLSLKKLNITDIINIITSELIYNLSLSNKNNLSKPLTQDDDNDIIISYHRLKLITSKNQYNINDIVIPNDLYNTLLNLKKYPFLNNYLDAIIKYMKEYDDLHNLESKINSKEFINNLTTTIENEDGAEEEEELDTSNNYVEPDFNNENFDYEPEYSDEDVNLKEVE